MREFRFILGKRVLIVFLALLVATGALLGVPAATRILAESPPPLLQTGIGDGWTLVPTSTESPSAPSARTYHAMAATPSGVLLFGGYFWDGHHEYRFNDTWLFNTATNTWGKLDITLTITAPSARFFHVMAATPSSDVLLFGGQDTSGLRNDTWLFNTTSGTWGLLNTGSASSPSARYLPAMAATSSGVLLFGGSSGGYPSDTWLFTYDGTGTGTWSELTITGSTPSGRQGPAMAATPSGDVLLFGGTIGSVVGDTWLFTYDGVSKTGSWTKLTLTNSPSARAGHAMAATPSGVLLFGGQGDSGDCNDTWLFTYDGVSKTGSWTKLTLTNAPSARSNHAMAYDSQSGKVILFGGYGGPVYFDDTWLYGPTVAPTLAVTSPTAGAHWPIGSPREITWTSTDLTSTTLTVLLARDGVHFTETITTGLTSTVTHYTWTVTGPGTINAKVRVLQDTTEGTSPGFFTIADAYPYTGTTTLNTSDPWLEISGGSGPGTLWVTPLEPLLTSNPDLNQFLQQTGQRAALFFDIRQENLTGTLTIVLHFNHQLGEETFVLYRWDGAGWVPVPGTLNAADHTFTFTIDASLLSGTPFALGGNPTAMPGISPWGLALLTLSLLSLSGWWFLRRRCLA